MARASSFTDLAPSSPPASHQLTSAAWLARLRWVAVAGQVATILGVVYGLGVPAPIVPLVTLVMVTVVTNAVFTWWVRHSELQGKRYSPRVWHMVLGGLMLLDLMVLSAMLGITGGPTNPFVIFYFVNLALCGILLPPRWAWFLCGVAILAVVMISYYHMPLDVLRDPLRLESFTRVAKPPLAAIGALAAFVACATVIVSFATRLTDELHRAQSARMRAEELRARSEKLEALGTLAAGAAHELATPLGTIAVVAGELERELQAERASTEVVSDVKLIRQSLDRCRKILDRMSMESGQAAGEAPRPITVEALIDHVIDELTEPERVAVRYRGGNSQANAQSTALHAPRVALAQAVRALVQNGLEASEEVVEITVDRTVEPHGRFVLLRIVDRGAGMTREMLDRVGEPFFTTKEPGRGTGLGVFLARSVIERLGGALEFRSQTGHGATVTIKIPVARLSTQTSEES